jgi:hypothetical protein
MIPRPLDTTPASWSEYNAVLDRMDGAARLYAAVELSDAVREVRLSGIRARFPDMTPQERVAQLVLEEYGVTLPSTT